MWSTCTTKGSAFNALLHLPTCAFLQSDARKTIVVDGSEKIPLMALCIFVVRIWSLQLLRLFKANPATHYMRPAAWLVEGWLRSCKMRAYRLGSKDLFDSLQTHTHTFLSVENCFGKCIDALAISCPTLNVTFSPGHDVALAKQRYRALQVEVIAAKNPCCSFRRRPD